MNLETKKLKTLIVYHANCIDGITSAAVVAKYLDEKQGLPVDDILLYPMTYDDPIIDLHQIITQADIEQLYIVDFSFSTENLVNLYEQIPDIHLYDHHASAFRNLMGADYPLSSTSRENFYLRDKHNDPTGIYIVLDNAECGASLCWKQLMHSPEAEEQYIEDTLPQLIKYVRDYDLWHFYYPDTAVINKFLKLKPKDAPTYIAFLESFKSSDFVRAAAREGKVMLSYESSLEDELISSGVCPIEIEGITGLSCNAPYAFASNIGHKLAAKSKTFGATWSQLADGKIVFSLRSVGDECDVSKLAECMGGGGHKNAAGFSFMSPSYDVERGITLWSKLPEADDHNE